MIAIGVKDLIHFYDTNVVREQRAVAIHYLKPDKLP